MKSFGKVLLATFFGMTSSAPILANGPSAGLDETLHPRGARTQGAQGIEAQKQEAQISQTQTPQYEIEPGLDTETLAEIEARLKAQGFYKGQINGKMTPELERALRQYQLNEGLTATGRVNEETMAALKMPIQKTINKVEVQAQENEKDQNSQNKLTDASKDPSIEKKPERLQTADSSVKHDSQIVKKVQSRLSDLGWEIKVDGVMGEDTERVLAQFQEKSDLAPTGDINSETLKALNIEAREYAE